MVRRGGCQRSPIYFIVPGLLLWVLVAIAAFRGGQTPDAFNLLVNSPTANPAATSGVTSQGEALESKVDVMAKGLDTKLAAAMNQRLDAKIDSLVAGIGPKIAAEVEQKLSARLAKQAQQAVAAAHTHLSQTLDEHVEARWNAALGPRMDPKIDKKVASVFAGMGLALTLNTSAASDSASSSPPAHQAAARTAAAAPDASRAGAPAPAPAAAPAAAESQPPPHRPQSGQGASSPAAAPAAPSAAPLAPAAAPQASVSAPAIPPTLREVRGGECRGSSVHAAPKEWCGKKKGPTASQSSCLTPFEADYMEKHARALGPGLAALRKCFPRGITVATMGYFRTGSTLLYNVARIWATLGAGTALVSGFNCQEPRSMGIGVEDNKAARCVVVCKDHMWKWGVAKNAEVTLMSRRDPYESVCSRKMMGLWCRLRQQGRKTQASAEEKAEYNKKCLREYDVEALEAQNQCKDLMRMQADIYHTRRYKGGIVNYDVLLSEYQTSPQVQVQQIARGMGICREAYEDTALVEFVVSVGTRLHDRPGDSMGITQMHDVHSEAQRERQCGDRLRKMMRGDALCREWMDAGASAEANAILRDLDENPPERRKR